ncbi:MAG: hypothetical protein KJO69_06265 [Gammaproteobacteria bacterium]|nr:hypothetical protein [Gammaproteobacteria bacterium]
MLVNPLAKSNELQVCVEKPIKRIYEESLLISEVARGYIPTREELVQIQEMIESWDDAKTADDYLVFHNFADGMYTREMHVNKGEIIVGKIHKNEHIVNLLKGRLIVIDEYANREIIAPCSFTSKPGVKRIGIILEDTVWQDIHRTDETTIERAENEIFMKDYNEIEVQSCQL